MKLLEITLGITATELALLNRTEVPTRFTFTTEAKINIQLEPPPPVSSYIECLRQEFTKIEPSLSGQSLEIMQFLLLDTPNGQVRREELIENIWVDDVPTGGRVRNAIFELNRRLEELEFGYVVRGSRRGIFKIEPR